MQSSRAPTPNLAESLLYKLVNNNVVEGVAPDRNRFREVFTSKYRKVRIYKVGERVCSFITNVSYSQHNPSPQIYSVSEKSKEWVANNRVCDAPGSWFCPGQYPPDIQKYLKEKRDFRQLEDFNTEGADDEYQKEYFENLNRGGAAAARATVHNDKRDPKKQKMRKLSAMDIDMLNENWADSELTSLMYDLIANDRYKELKDYIAMSPEIVHVRSEDGRGPMFWAHEFKRTKMIQVFKALGVSEERTDANGKTPLDSK